MSTNRRLATIMAVALSVMAGTASAQPQHAEHHAAQDPQGGSQATSPCPMMGGMKGGGMMSGGMMGQMMDGTGGGMMASGMMDIDPASLSEQQLQRLAALHGRQAEEHFMLMMRMKEAQQQLQEARSAQPLDIETVEQAYDRLTQVRKEMLVSHLQARHQIQEIVGPQQSPGN